MNKKEWEVDSQDSPLALVLMSLARQDSLVDVPGYPDYACYNCGSTSYWLRESGRWGKGEWLCQRCHPNPEGGNGQ